MPARCERLNLRDPYKVETVVKMNVYRKVSNKGYVTYKYRYDGQCWTHTDMEELSGFTFHFGPGITIEEIIKIKDKWKHKLINGADYGNMGGLYA